MKLDGLGTLVRQFRRQARLTQYELAEISTVSVRAIRDLENGRVERPRQETVRLIANGLHLGESQRLVLHAACGGNPEDAVARLIGDAAPIAPPARAIRLSGREVETQAVVRSMTHDLNRWITVTGLHGVGKTELALDVAHTLYQLHACSVLWVACDDSLPPTDAPSRFGVDSAVVAKVSRIGEQLLGNDFDAHQLCQMIGQRRTLLVLDGCDLRLIRSERMMALLSECRGLRLLLTTRDSAAMPAKHLLPLEPLALPERNGDDGKGREEHFAAVQLMLSYIRRLRPGTVQQSAVKELADVCRALDCIPGALKLAAEWALLLSPAQLLERATRDPLSLLVSPTEGPSERDFRPVLAHAVRELSAADRRVLRDLCLSRTSWTVQDVSMIIGGTEGDSARAVYGLYLRGLVRRTHASVGSRFRVLNLVMHTVAEAEG